MKKITVLWILVWLFPICLLAENNKFYQPGEVRSYLQPSFVQAVRQPILSLNGTWKFKPNQTASWTTIQVPGEPVMQGYSVPHDKPFYYKKTFSVPADFQGKHLILRFNGVYTQAFLRINGKAVREHRGGFTRWETDVTPFIKPGKKNVIELDVVDRVDDISYASGYAQHPIGGILRDVELYALPTSHLMDVRIDTHFDKTFTDATLQFGTCFAGEAGTLLQLTLKDMQGKTVPLPASRFALKEGENEFTIHVPHPLKWDAEHPNLYTLEVQTLSGDVPTAIFTRKIGFRQIEIVKDRVMVNGMPVKLRGACRHDVHPTLGRTTTAELDSLDAVLFKQANMNFVRTSHYPPSERFLEYCDKYGIYVESETAACFIANNRLPNFAPGAFQSDPAHAGQFMGQCQEMVKSFRNHPSVFMWSIGNECVYGTNFQRTYEWVKANDKTRPVIFSYPGTAFEKKAKVFDILSMHYQNVRGDLNQWGVSVRNFQGYGMPVIFDEWAHPACYTYNTLQHDPNIREFWGKSLDMMWSGLFPTSGGLGGGVWSYIDETFSVPTLKYGTPFWKEFTYFRKPKEYFGQCVGYGEWGIVDVWRRQKPEFWATKKAYSPVQLLAGHTLVYTEGQPISLTIYNRFDHTNLNEIKAQYIYLGATKPLALHPVAPHQKGMLTLPAEDWKEHETVRIEFFDAQGTLIDASQYFLGSEKITYPSLLAGTDLKVNEEDNRLVVKGEGFEVPFDKATGLISQARAGDEVLIEKGPFLNLDVSLNHLTDPADIINKNYRLLVKADDWKKESFRYEQKADGVYVYIIGTFGKVRAHYEVKITPQGVLAVRYTTDNVPNGYLRESGLKFVLSPAVQHLDWHRQAYWNCYPANSFAGPKGSVDLYKSKQAAYGQQPVQPWHDDTRDYYYWSDRGTNCNQPLTKTAKGMKEHIHHYVVSTPQQHQLAVVSKDASVACRMEKMANEDLHLFVNTRWDYPEIAWGNYCKRLEAYPCYGQLQIQLK